MVDAGSLNLAAAALGGAVIDFHATSGAEAGGLIVDEAAACAGLAGVVSAGGVIAATGPMTGVDGMLGSSATGFGSVAAGGATTDAVADGCGAGVVVAAVGVGMVCRLIDPVTESRPCSTEVTRA